MGRSDRRPIAGDHLGALAKKVGIWLLQRLAEQAFPTAIVWAIAAWGTARVWAYPKGVPLLIFVLVLIPASFGAVAFVRMYVKRRPDFHVTADPLNSYCCEATWERNQPAAQVRLIATFANGSDYDLLLMYAYLKGTRPLMHFQGPIHVPPRRAIQADVLFFCTWPTGIVDASYNAKVAFVDAGGRRYLQRLTIRGVPRQASVSPPHVAAGASSAAPASQPQSKRADGPPQGAVDSTSVD